MNLLLIPHLVEVEHPKMHINQCLIKLCILETWIIKTKEAVVVTLHFTARKLAKSILQKHHSPITQTIMISMILIFWNLITNMMCDTQICVLTCMMKRAWRNILIIVPPHPLFTLLKHIYFI